MEGLIKLVNILYEVESHESMNRFLTFAFCLILLLTPITGCLEDTTPEDETTPDSSEGSTPGNGGTSDNSNENGDNSGGGETEIDDDSYDDDAGDTTGGTATECNTGENAFAVPHNN